MKTLFKLLIIIAVISSCKKSKNTPPPPTNNTNVTTSAMTGNYWGYKGHNCHGSNHTKIELSNGEYYITSTDYWSCGKKLHMTASPQGSLFNLHINDIYEYSGGLDTLTATGYFESDTLTLYISNTVIGPGSVITQPFMNKYYKY